MREIKPAWIAVGVLVVIVLLVLLSKASEELAPQPHAVWVAIQPEGSNRATVGPVELAAGSDFLLHAVIEAKTFGGETIYYTEAEELHFPGREVSSESVRRWTRPFEVRVLWFSVEGSPPYREFEPGEGASPPAFRETFRADWGQAWSVPGSLRPTVPNYLPDEEQPDVTVRFGTQRFHVRVELLAEKTDLQPVIRLRSWGALDVLDRAEDFPGVVATLPGALEVPSRVFGLAQLETGDQGAGDVEEQMTSWTRRGVSFSRLPLLAWWLEDNDVRWEDLAWQTVDLETTTRAVRPGDLVRAGSRVVWVLEDQGDLGRLDDLDLCLDFDRGARVSRLGNIFTGEGLVDWARAPEGN